MRTDAATPQQVTEPRPSNLIWYITHARWAVILSSPLLYVCFIPFVLLDLTASVYQAICFPIYGIPKVVRADYIVYDRVKLRYLNLVERLNCLYCSYANGVAPYVAEIAARTEQHWCPIQHSKHPKVQHSRYQHFLNYGDGHGYAERSEEVRRDFRDLHKGE